MNKKVILAVCALFVWATSATAQEWAVSTNFMDYANLGTLNASAEMSVSRHWSIGAGVKYNPYTFKQRSASLSGKWWPWYSFSGWWVAASLRAQEFNTGGYSYIGQQKESHTQEGDRYGGGLAAGYTYMLSKHFNLDFGAGIWGGYQKYTVYSCPTCGRIVDSGTKAFLLPSEITLALTYLF